MAVFKVVALCSLVEVYQCFRGACCLHHQGDEFAMMIEATSTSETSVNFYQTTWPNNPENSHLRTHHHENLRFHLLQAGSQKLNREQNLSLVRYLILLFV
jgi:hypothetical protein